MDTLGLRTRLQINIVKTNSVLLLCHNLNKLMLAPGAAVGVLVVVKAGRVVAELTPGAVERDRSVARSGGKVVIPGLGDPGTLL